jgi:hypothetical protein
MVDLSERFLERRLLKRFRHYAEFTELQEEREELLFKWHQRYKNKRPITKSSVARMIVLYGNEALLSLETMGPKLPKKGAKVDLAKYNEAINQASTWGSDARSLVRWRLHNLAEQFGSGTEWRRFKEILERLKVKFTRSCVLFDRSCSLRPRSWPRSRTMRSMLLVLRLLGLRSASTMLAFLQSSSVR